MGNRHSASHSLMLNAEGDIVEIDATYQGKPLFRKMRPDENEQKIALIVQSDPHPNVVNIYYVCDEYIDMELLDTSSKVFNAIDVERAHNYFLKKGIVYMDWKPDNYGLDHHGITKVFDFNSAGIFDKKTGQWIDPAPEYYAWRIATGEGMTSPYLIDLFTFEKRAEIWSRL